ncbi:MAG: Zn-dependent hydrolase, partial [Candidatus Methanomethylophilaceae archaeon]|nr:Zn-dependent hydrolase [Candidatus Methanomethylophilaceae archaeon]
MVPTGEVFTMEMRDVRRFIELVNPTITVPMHYRVGGLTLPISTIDDFLEIIPEEYVDYIGNEIDVTPDDLTEMKECWIFER